MIDRKSVTDPHQIRPYINNGWDLIPLHHFEYFSSNKNGEKVCRGKTPVDKGWLTNAYSNEKMFEHMKDGKNVGVRLRNEDIVIDVDPRNFDNGDEPLLRILSDFNLKIENFPVVETGSGGLHIYMKKPSDVLVKNTIKKYNGIEYKSKGRQVVSAGSVHPEALKPYFFDPMCAPLSKISFIPDELLETIKREDKISNNSDQDIKAIYNKKTIKSMLEILNPVDFRGHDEWFKLMQSCHFASKGTASQEFIDWSIRDNKYSDQSEIIYARWGSLKNSGKSMVTNKTLERFVIDSGGVVPTIGFEKVKDDDLGSMIINKLENENLSQEFDSKDLAGLLAQLDSKYKIVLTDKARAWWLEDDLTFGLDEEGGVSRKAWRTVNLSDLRVYWSNVTVKKGNRKIPIMNLWEVKTTKRFDRVIFEPEKTYSKNILNLWSGWGVESREGSWKYLKELLYEVLCSDDEMIYNYVLNWSAFLVQKPAKPAGVAVCFQGGKGTGKGTFGRALATLCGVHGLHSTSPMHLSGRFTQHLQNLIYIFADEAMKPGDMESENRMKALITEPVLTFEGKGTNPVAGRNMLHILMATNADWVIRADIDQERRYLINRVNNKWVNKQDKFKKLNKEMENGGYSAMLYELKNRNITDWHPRIKIPNTDAMTEQKLQGMKPEHQWWYEILSSGVPEFDLISQSGEVILFDKWNDDRVRFFKKEAGKSYIDTYNTHRRGKPKLLVLGLYKELRRIIPDIKESKAHVCDNKVFTVKPGADGRSNCFSIPSLKICRNHFNSYFNEKIEWVDDNDIKNESSSLDNW
ncbi:MAG: DUF5906 domain-containing protein [bacterium]